MSINVSPIDGTQQYMDQTRQAAARIDDFLKSLNPDSALSMYRVMRYKLANIFDANARALATPTITTIDPTTAISCKCDDEGRIYLGSQTITGLVVSIPNLRRGNGEVTPFRDWQSIKLIKSYQNGELLVQRDSYYHSNGKDVQEFNGDWVRELNNWFNTVYDVAKQNGYVRHDPTPHTSFREVGIK